MTRRDTGPVGHGVSSPDFVGRGEELGLLVAAFDAAAGGRAGAVLVGGAAGIGKTRLVEEFCRLARDRGALTATGVCVPVAGGGLPYGPVAGLVRDIGRQLGDAAADLLEPMAEGLRSALPGPGDPANSTLHPRQPTTDELVKTRRFEAFLTSVTTLAERSPLVLVFDDLQWADSSSAELLSFLTRNLTDARVLLVGTMRTDEVGPGDELRPWLAEFTRHNRVTDLHLDGLDHEEMTTLIGGVLGRQPDWTLVEAVWARSQGNPFFAEELTAAGPAPSLPPELARVIMTRVEGLSKKAQQLLRMAAIAGLVVEHRLLATVADAFDADALDGALAEAIDGHILVVDESRSGYRFRHALLREAVEASLLPGERIRIHRRLAEALSADPSLVPAEAAQRAATLAVHWWAAGEWAQAYAASRQAAEAARDVLAFPEALVHLERALAALARMPVEARLGPADYLRLLDLAADVAYLAGAGARSVELCQMAIDASDGAGDPTSVARRYAMLGRSGWALGNSDAAMGAYRRAIELMPVDPPTVELAQVLAEEARGFMLQSRYTDSERVVREAIAVAQATGARAEESHAVNTLGCCRALSGHYDEGIDLLRQALAIAEEVGVPEHIDRAEVNLSEVLLDSDRVEEAAGFVFDRFPAADGRGVFRLNGASVNSANALIRLGRWADADTLLRAINDHDIGICVSSPQLVPLPLEVRRGRFDKAHSLLAEADELTAGLTIVQTRGSFHMLAAELALEEGRPDAAYEEVERALALAVGTENDTLPPEMCALGTRALADRLEYAAAHGLRCDADKLRLLADGLVQEVERLVAAQTARGTPPTRRTVAFAASCAAERSRLQSSDPELWANAAARWQTAGEPYQNAYCRWREAEALLESRADRYRAEECLQQAWRVTLELGAQPLRERIEGLAQRSRVALRNGDGAEASDGSTVATDLGLTPREIEVLGQLAEGKTDREIADTLFISKKTASVHVSNLLRKLDVANRIEAGKVGQAHRLG